MIIDEKRRVILISIVIIMIHCCYPINSIIVINTSIVLWPAARVLCWYMLHLSKQAPVANINNTNDNNNNNNNNDKNNDIQRTSFFQNTNILELGTRWRFYYPSVIIFFPFLIRSIRIWIFQNAIGAGIGVCGILLASLQTARSVVLTDYQDVVLSILEENIESNSQLCKFPLSI